MADFETWQQSLAPTWFGDRWRAWLGASGAMKDLFAERLKAGVKVCLPGLAPEDALPFIGSERVLPRGPAETADAYAERLRTAWDAWQRVGTPLGILLQIEVLYPGIPVVIVQQAGRGFTLDPDTTKAPLERLVIQTLGPWRGETGWRFDDNSGLPPSQGFWSRFGVIFPGPLPTGWAAAVSPPLDGSTPSKAEVNGIIRIVRKWKAGKATCVWIKVLTSGAMWGWPVDQDWGDPGLVWGGTVVTWNGSTEY